MAKKAPEIPLGVIGVPIRVPQKPFARARVFQAKLLIELSRLPRPDVLYVRLSAGRVSFTGAVHLGVVPRYISACNFCLLPKRNLLSGVSPFKLYEYMACARPVVATDVPGLEVVTIVGAGVNAKAGSPVSLADAIEELIRRRQEWEDMGRRGRL